MLVDSHCHLDFFNSDLDQIIKAAHDASVEYILSVCTNLDNFPKIMQIAKTYNNVFASLGIHPSEVLNQEPSPDELAKLANDPLVIGIGETGLDYHYDSVSRKMQQERFRNHIRAALQIKKSLIVHTRDAREDTLQIMREEGADKVSGVMHCFTEKQETAQKALDMGFYISFSGIITFRNANDLRNIAKYVPLDRILVETDAPYLAPVPCRGKPNQPAYVRYVAECIAKLRDISYETIAEHTTQNFLRLFLKMPGDIKGLQKHKKYGEAECAE